MKCAVSASFPRLESSLGWKLVNQTTAVAKFVRPRSLTRKQVSYVDRDHRGRCRGRRRGRGICFRRVGSVAPPPAGNPESPAASAAASLSARWHEIQALFVDDPRSSAEMAAGLDK